MIKWARSVARLKIKGRSGTHKGFGISTEERKWFGSSSKNSEYVGKVINENKYEHIKDLKSQELRVLSENCCAKRTQDVVIWSEISRNAIEKCEDFKYFDALLLLSSFEKMNIIDNNLYKTFSDVFLKQINHLEPRHFIMLINLYCKANIFPRVLFVQVFHAIIKYSSKLYPEEYVDLLSCFADLNIVNKDLIKTLCKSISKNVNLFDYVNVCSIVGCLRRLEIHDDVIYYVLDEKQQKELKLLTVQEIFDIIKKIKFLKYSWELYEQDLIKEFLNRLNNFKGEKDINQLDDPFICLNFLVSKNYITNNFLLALSKWCASHVYEYPSRSSKRPLAYQLIKLYQLMKQKNVQNYDFIEKAIHRFVISRGGLAVNRDKMNKPVSYQKGRKYIYTQDPIEARSGMHNTMKAEVRKGLEVSTNMAITNDYHPLHDSEEQNISTNIEDDILKKTQDEEEKYLHKNLMQKSNDNTMRHNIPFDDYNYDHHPKHMSKKQRSINLSLEKNTENKKSPTHSNGRYCNFKLRQRPKRTKNKAVPDGI
ncbi:hypothetical protein, conserved [Plasmodium gonderi]|uniref:RNA-editing substrate-binding complex 6 protein domain-containing protein n=1 Tax=Plasmodium gonderi TaxID=77519 RepID=A0A1Y1JCS1_PLAGO|nr:hypothetical protein, conserved [Plasmodium gonderi]GAW80030.1 hypothetical protein, conserved [Plasmodium gonderi]